ncbi:MAG: hypothetical protein WKF84_02630 [Pyrinomonadaceae bacterium]
MLRTIWGDDERYRKQYWSEIDGVYFAGDGARRDAEGYFWIMGRVDDVINVSGHRLGTMEVESALVSHRGGGGGRGGRTARRDERLSRLWRSSHSKAIASRHRCIKTGTTRAMSPKKSARSPNPTTYASPTRSQNALRQKSCGDCYEKSPPATQSPATPPPWKTSPSSKSSALKKTRKG